MKSLVAAIAGLAVMVCAPPARAYVVEITTSFELAGVTDKDQLHHALESAVDDVLKHAIAFSPTVVTVQNARVVGDRMYILLLIADADGEQVLKVISADGGTSGPRPPSQ